MTKTLKDKRLLKRRKSISTTTNQATPATADDIPIENLARISLRRKVDSEPERKLLINLIVSDEACKVLLPQIKTGDLQASYSGTIIKWIKTFYEKEGHAPRKDIAPVFESLKTGLEPAEAKLVSKLLEILSEEYSNYEDIDTQLSIFENKQYLQKQHAKRHIDDVNKWIEIGDLDKAEKRAMNYSPVFAENNEFKRPSELMATFDQFMNQPMEKRLPWLDPWS